MRLQRRYQQLSVWNKWSFWGSVASVAALMLAFAVPASRRLFAKHPLHRGSAADLRFTYYRFEGVMLLERALDGYGFDTTNGFASKPQWLQNDIFQNVADVLAENPNRQKQDRFEFDELFLEVSGEPNRQIVTKKIEDPDPAPEHRLFRGYATFRDPSWTDIPLNSLLESVRTDPFWTISRGYWSDSAALPIPAQEVEFFGMPPAADLVGVVTDPITKRLATKYPERRDLAILIASTTHGTYTRAVHVREITLNVLDIENAGTMPIVVPGIETISAAPCDWTTLSSEANIKQMLSTSSVETKPLPIDSLASHEHPFIPLSIEFGVASSFRGRANPNYESTIENRDFPAPWRNLTPLTVQTALGVDNKYDLLTAIETFPVSLMRNKPDYRCSFEPRYYLGSVIQVKTVNVSEPSGSIVALPVRPFDSRNVLARGWFAKGSCPVLYVGDNHMMHRLRPVLIDAIARNHEMTDSIELPRYTTWVEIRELEPETSYVSEVSFTAVYENGATSKMPVGQLSPCTLHQGDTVKLAVPHSSSLLRVKLVVRGFYVPDKLRVSKVRPAS